jgi:hypothetical protein
MKRTILFALVSVVFSVPVVRADIVLEDHFDDGVLDPAWNVTFEEATGWVYEESGTNLTVTDIGPTVVHAVSRETYAKVILTQTFTPLSDFGVDFDLSWDSISSDRTMQKVEISLYSSDGTAIALAGYSDPWVSHRGDVAAELHSDTFLENTLEADFLPYSGSASIEIMREGADVEILWNGELELSGNNANPLSRVDVVFSYYAYDGLGGVSFFGTESVDLIRVEGVPEPGTLLLLGVGGILIRRRSAT